MTSQGKHEEPQRVVIRDKRRIDPVTGEPRTPEPEQVWTAPGDTTPGAGPAVARPDSASWRAPDDTVDTVDAEIVEEPAEDPRVAELTEQLAERTADLQRLSAEYANYRKRVDRDRALIGEAATGGVLSSLLPVLDDVDLARQHGDLTGAFKSAADQLATVLGKLGLAPFGEPGDPFDPTRHEAVAHSTSPDVTTTTCVAVMRRGYQQGDRLLRPALVAVADPEDPPAAPVDAVDQ